VTDPTAGFTHLELRCGEATHLWHETGERQQLEALLELEALLGPYRYGVSTLVVEVCRLDSGPVAVSGVSRLVETLSNLQMLVVRCRGAQGTSDNQHLFDLHDVAKRRGLVYVAEFPLDAEADAHAALAGTRTSLSIVLAASRALRAESVDVRWVVPLLPERVHRLEALFSLARDEGVDPVLVPASMDRSSPISSEAALQPEEALFALDFLTHRLLEEERPLASRSRLEFYQALCVSLRGSLSESESEPHPEWSPPTRRVVVFEPRAVRGEERMEGVEERMEGVEERTERREERAKGAAEAEGTAWALREDRIPSFEVADAGAARQPVPAPMGRDATRIAADLLEVSIGAARALVQWLMAWPAALRRADRGAAKADQLPSVLVIGAYGGEHIGDAAILGGVLTRLHRRHATTRAILMTQRPDHTRELVGLLDLPVEVSVELHEPGRVRARLPEVDAVVFAGGPLMDLPKQLVQHLYTVSLARRRHLPFIIEGIGAGPFKRWPSEWIARRLVKQAERIAVRTTDDAKTPLMRGLDPEVGRDPAFDYLETRQTDLTRLPERDREWIERLLRDTEGRLKVGLNLRPIRHVFTEGASAAGKIAHTRGVEAHFEEQLAEAMRRFHQASSAPPCFVFYPMDATHAGSSDLRSAYRIRRLLRGDVDFRVWESTPSIDGVVSLLRRLDIVIAMRFHATIFALAQRCPVVGIDYRPGKRDKVAALLDDFGLSENCQRIDEMTSDWLCERLDALTRSARVG
jgi:polysaccharide pyruvyl transferase WcaK-like protein